ncbi:hypothetical protein [Allomuricauda sp. F6463D]|uniref:hypothetical protein n=1 Tax=Allomuricauda sp. F6463D TaxID=2926409 RepID=UPI001FF53DF0|nr:hypothetical protein [Muricauda sp. F6463D]
MESVLTNNTIWYVLAVLGLIYLIILFRNRKATKRRKSRRFMEGKRQHDKKERP